MQTTKNLVSILIPNYNKASYLRPTLDSIMAQTYSNWECIIVDDHSTDISWEIIEEYAKTDSRFKIYKRPNHLAKGGNVCRNYAFTNSVGDFVVFLIRMIYYTQMHYKKDTMLSQIVIMIFLSAMEFYGMGKIKQVYLSQIGFKGMYLMLLLNSNLFG